MFSEILTENFDNFRLFFINFMVLKAPAPVGFFRGRRRGILGPRQPYGDDDASLEDAEDDGIGNEEGTAEC